MKKKLFWMSLFVAFLLPLVMFGLGCKDGSRAQFFAFGSKHRVTLYSGGQKVGMWISTGNVSKHEHSDGYYFEDEATHKLIEVSGSVVIEQL